MQVPDSFEEFKQEIGQVLKKGKGHGLDQEVMELGNMMTGMVSPKTAEEKLVKEVWTIASSQEKEVLAQLLVRLVGRHIH